MFKRGLTSEFHLSPELRGRSWRRPWRLGAIQVAAPGKTHRVEAVVGRRTLWFESPDTPLSANAEAFGSALLLAAAARGRQLAFATPPDTTWFQNLSECLEVAARWWGYPPPSKRIGGASGPPQRDNSGRSALCFSGGVDSFYSLLRGGEKIDNLVFVHGYDIALTDSRRAVEAEHSLRDIASSLGIKAVLLRTNLRRHPAFKRSDWEQVHGGALAATGHLLGEHVSRLLISASYPRAFNRPWGSHWELDPWWSSSRVTVVHVGADKWRAEKLVALLDEPLVRRHLRVCWENRSPHGNCGQCEKCLRTMLVLDGHGHLEHFPGFPNTASLATNLKRVRRLRPDLIRVYAGFLEMELSSAVRAAVRELVERSEGAVCPPSGWWRRSYE